MATSDPQSSGHPKTPVTSVLSVRETGETWTTNDVSPSLRFPIPVQPSQVVVWHHSGTSCSTLPPLLYLVSSIVRTSPSPTLLRKVLCLLKNNVQVVESEVGLLVSLDDFLRNSSFSLLDKSTRKSFRESIPFLPGHRHSGPPPPVYVPTSVLSYYWRQVHWCVTRLISVMNFQNIPPS